MWKLARNIRLYWHTIVVKFCVYVPLAQISTALNVPDLIPAFASSPSVSYSLM